jgi:hypothetical protein
MTDNSKIRPVSNDRPEEARPQQSEHGAQQPQADAPDAPAQSGQRGTPGRRPLFRN